MKHLFFTSFIFANILLFGMPTYVFAQGESNIWYFGNKGGLDFSETEPKVISNNMLSTTEGCATISNEKGQLLFYTDGISVWNKEHKVMQNGVGLKGNVSSTQSAIIVKKPLSKDLYYIFTVDVVDTKSVTSNGLQYSIVDISKQNGLGEIVEKNISVMASVTERITGVRHKNNRDVWIISHLYGNDTFVAFLLTDKGVNLSNIIKSNVGLVHSSDNDDNSIGYLKVSPNGQKLAVAIKLQDMFQLFDFNYETGEVKNPITIKQKAKSFSYGLEFSSDGTKLYTSNIFEKGLYQYDISSGKEADIMASETQLAIEDNFLGALQLAIDGKIYVSVHDRNYLGVINHPNKKGKDCGYTSKAIDLGSAKAQLGLPTFVQTYFEYSENLQKITSKTGKKVKIGETFSKVILFDFDKFVIKPEYFQTLNELVEFLNASPNINIEVAGHTDNEGLDAKNMVLSNNRAKAVANYLIKKGINQKRIISKGFGKSQPVVKNDTPENKALNRRIEFLLKNN